MSLRTRRAAALIAVYLVCLTVVLLWPTTDRQDRVIGTVAGIVHRTGIPDSLATSLRLEFVLNAAIIVPVTLLGSLAFPRFGWRDWTALGFCGAVVVESIQGLLLPGRHSSTVDVVANTVGALLGAALVALPRGRSRKPSRVRLE